MGHLLGNLTRFTRLLRSLGLSVPPGSTVEAVRAAQCVGLRSRSDFRHALRTALVQRAEDLKLFDEAFRVFWAPPSGTQTQLDLRPLGAGDRRFGDPVVEMESLTAAARDRLERGESRVERVRIATYSDREVLREKDFKRLTPEETAQAVELLRELRWRPSLKTTKRWKPGRGTALDARRMLSRLARRPNDAEPPPRRERKLATRRLVLLCDISGSMERYTRMFLWFACCLTSNLDRTECFLFATRLTRVTSKLRGLRARNPLQAISRLVPDWSGGTRIGDSLRAFNMHWARRTLGCGAVVLVISDGWDRGDPSAMQAEVSRLRRSSHRLIWLSPLLGSPGYRPLTRGLRASLAHVDDFLPVRNLASLDLLAEHLNRLSEKAPGRSAWHIRRAQGPVC